MCADSTENKTYPTVSYIKSLLNQGIILDQIISFALRNYDVVSYADLGLYDENVISDPNTLTWIPSKGDETDCNFYSQNLVQGIRFRT